MSSESYQIKLPQFEGPFDLLLFFIERDELDIYDIPIHRLTKEFLAYIREIEQVNIELASEFILFISTLMRIKSKMLLPRKEIDDAGNEIDPRAELIDKILEYKKFKETALSFSALEAERLLQEKRGNAAIELTELGKENAEGTEMQHISLFKLMSTFERVVKKLNERNNQHQHVVVKYNYSMDSSRAFLLESLKDKVKVKFESVFMNCENRIHAIFTFLAMLELIQMNYLDIVLGTGRNNFYISWNAELGQAII